MATTVEELETSITAAIAAGFRNRLIDRGEARSMIWRSGQLPEGAPAFTQTLSYDLYSYSYALLGMGLRLRESGGDEDIARQAFEHAAMALESILIKGAQAEDGRSFHFIIAAAAYHLGRFSARAYSLLSHGLNDASFSPIEKCLSHLILRNISDLEREIVGWRVNGPGTDESIAAQLESGWAATSDDAPFPQDDGNSYVSDALGSAIIDNFLAGMGLFIFAIERADRAYVNQAIERLRIGLDVCTEVNLLPQWWSFRLAIHIIDDLWASSFHARLPLLPDGLHAPLWRELRSRFISLLMKRPRAEIDLWPSQLEAAVKASNEDQDLVVSLPTSAGKTRVAELCILRCLAARRRVVFITPLRALSAQTELTLQRTFIPLGKSISTLYGSIGTSEFETNALSSRDIVVGTPEKLDFALRNDPNLLNDVGLIVLDEGHMIGLQEREVRYEVQIQRLLRRADASTRRIVCLSAILPDGEELDDFVAWLSRDSNDSLVRSKWRPTRLRFGEVTWITNRARLDVRVGAENSFVPNFIRAKAPTSGTREALFPRNHRELVLATTWRLADDGQSVLIYCPERRSVEPYAREIVKLHRQGLLPSLIGNAEAELSRALAIGAEWLGDDNDVLKCLRLGVAVHHGALPTPFRKEVERLLREGILKVTVSSPTLAQGLNLSATTVVMHGLIRNRSVIDASEFKNVVGRAGRAFVDVEGLVLLPFFEPNPRRRSQWESLTSGEGAREMESGLIRLITTFLQRILNQRGGTLAQLAEYVLNNAQAWNFFALANETAETIETQQRLWEQHLTTLDTAILSLMGEQEVQDAEVAAALDQILSSSLWKRRLERRTDELRQVFESALRGRTNFLWSNSTAIQRRSYFLAGVGYETGRQLDAAAAAANELLVQANGRVLSGEVDAAITTITSLAEILFVISPFTPNPMPANWRTILAAWLRGEPLAALAASDDEVLRFIEDGLVYRLPWGVEAIRVRALAAGDVLQGAFGLQGLGLGDFETGLVAPAVETGTLNRSAAVLMQAGFTSRLAAIKAVTDTQATFTDFNGMKDWIASDQVVQLSATADWPSPPTAEMWKAFLATFIPPDKAKWTEWTYSDQVTWMSPNIIPAAGAPVRIVPSPNDAGVSLVLSPDHTLLGRLANRLNPARKGLVLSDITQDRTGVAIRYVGPPDLTPAQLG